MTTTYGPVDTAVKEWLRTTAVGQITPAIHMAMPKSNPNPAVILSLIGGGPLRRADLPLTRYRLSFTCYGKTRETASELAYTLIDALEQISIGTAGALAAGVWLGAAEVLNIRWLPDPDSDTPRYIVDALITTVS